MKKIIMLFLFSTCCYGYIDDLTTVEGKQFQTKKEKVFILFWATWCSECKDKMKKDLPQLSKRNDLEVVTVNIDANLKRVKHYVNKRKPKVIVLRDETKALLKKLEIGAVPHWAYLKKIAGKWKIIEHAVAFDRSKIDVVVNQ